MSDFGADHPRLRMALTGAAMAACLAGSLLRPATTDADDRLTRLIAVECLECHSATERKGGLDLTRRATALQGGDSGPALAPGDPETSLLWARVAAGEMPPERALADEDKQLLREWIAGGAAWPEEEIDPLKYSGPRRAGYDWWSLQRLQRPKIPSWDAAGGDEVNGSRWIRTPIDSFVLDRLRLAKLTPSAEADRRVLLRRLTFDLIGLPPTPEQVERFLQDGAPDAYERQVDELLASPAYGQKWARHWLDLARFGESQGFERDKLRTNLWPYRDWVVSALNADMPYNEFARRQIAGDVLTPASAEGVVATGFLVAGPYDEVGQSQQSAAMRAVVRQDEIEDLVSVVGQTFLGLTVNCARCHDHKFDPVSQAEYYGLAAALAGVRHGERPIALPQHAHFARRLEARRETLQKRLEEILAPAVAQFKAARRNAQPATAPSAADLAELPPPILQFDPRNGSGDWVLHGGARLADGRLLLDGKSAFAASPPQTRELKEKTLEVWAWLDDLEQQGGGAVSVETLDGAVFDAIAFGEREQRRWMAGSDGFRRTQSFGGEPESASPGELVHFVIAYAADGQVVGYRNGRPYGKPFTPGEKAAFPSGGWRMLLGLRHSPPGGNRHLGGGIVLARLYDRTLTAAQVAAAMADRPPDDYVPLDKAVETLTPELAAEAKALRFEIEQLVDYIGRAKATTVYAVTPQSPEPTHVLLRGNPATPSVPAAPGGVRAASGKSADFALPLDAPDADRRIALANWITDREHPLFARVMVNRIWKHHFGQGLVESASDFGFNGGRPSHPELLDWLASEFVDSGYSIKAIHRLICQSSVYRQSSAFRAECASADADSRLLWRKPPQRLEAEILRDAALFASGDLDLSLGGPGYCEFTTVLMNSQFYDMLDPVGVSFQRRSLYRTWVRSGRSALLDVFDCPDPSTKTPNRAVTTTPLQALALLNDSFMLRMAERLAERVRRQAGPEEQAQIDLLFRITTARPPSEQEIQLCEPLVDGFGLAALCRVLLSSNEFVFID